MPIVIKPKISETASSIPTTSDLATGEIAMNTADQKIYTKDSNGAIIIVGSGVGGATTAYVDAKAITMAIALG